MSHHPRWIDIDSPSAYALWWGRTLAAQRDGTPSPPPLPRRPWWHYALDDILDGLEAGWLICAPWIVGGVVGAFTYWMLTR